MSLSLVLFVVFSGFYSICMLISSLRKQISLGPFQDKHNTTYYYKCLTQGILPPTIIVKTYMTTIKNSSINHLRMHAHFWFVVEADGILHRKYLNRYRFRSNQTKNHDDIDKKYQLHDTKSLKNKGSFKNSKSYIIRLSKIIITISKLWNEVNRDMCT